MLNKLHKMYYQSDPGICFFIKHKIKTLCFPVMIIKKYVVMHAILAIVNGGTKCCITFSSEFRITFTLYIEAYSNAYLVRNALLFC